MACSMQAQPSCQAQEQAQCKLTMMKRPGHGCHSMKQDQKYDLYMLAVLSMCMHPPPGMLVSLIRSRKDSFYVTFTPDGLKDNLPGARAADYMLAGLVCEEVAFMVKLCANAAGDEWIVSMHGRLGDACLGYCFMCSA